MHGLETDITQTSTSGRKPHRWTMHRRGRNQSVPLPPTAASPIAIALETLRQGMTERFTDYTTSRHSERAGLSPALQVINFARDTTRQFSKSPETVDLARLVSRRALEDGLKFSRAIDFSQSLGFISLAKQLSLHYLEVGVVDVLAKQIAHEGDGSTYLQKFVPATSEVMVGYGATLYLTKHNPTSPIAHTPRIPHT